MVGQAVSDMFQGFFTPLSFWKTVELPRVMQF
jgi:hypothetical protein